MGISGKIFFFRNNKFGSGNMSEELQLLAYRIKFRKEIFPSRL